MQSSSPELRIVSLILVFLSSYSLLLVLFETELSGAAQNGLKLSVVLSQTPKSWNSRCWPLPLTSHGSFQKTFTGAGGDGSVGKVLPLKPESMSKKTETETGSGGVVL